MQLVYRFDKNGYYVGTCQAQIFEGDLLLPPDCTDLQPNHIDGYWDVFKNNAWNNEKIPTSCNEAIESGLTCISNDPNQHNLAVKALLEFLVSQDSDNYKIFVDDNFIMSIEEIPEPTEEEKQQKEDEEKDHALDQAIEELGKEMLKAQMCENEEWIAEIKVIGLAK